MELSNQDLMALIGNAVAQAVQPLSAEIDRLKSESEARAAQEAAAAAQAAQSNQAAEEAREAAEMGRYLKDMRQRLVNAGLISPEYNNI